MKLKLISLLIAITFILPGGIVLATTAGATYSGTIVVSDNGSAATNVSTVMTLNTQNLIDHGWVNASCNNTSIQTNAGADTAYMPGYSSNPWCIFVPSISANTTGLNYKLYTGGAASMGSKLEYFPDTAGMTTVYGATLKPGNAFELEIKGYFDTSASQVGNYILANPSGLGIMVPSAGNIKAEIYASASTNITQSTTSTDMAFAGIYTRLGQRYDSFPGGTATAMSFWLKKTLSPIGTAYARVRKVSDDSLIGTIGSINVATLTGSLVKYTFSTTPFIVPPTDVRFTIEYSGDNVTDYVSMGRVTPSAGAGSFTYYSGTTWGDASTYDAEYEVEYKAIAASVTGAVDSGEHTIKLTERPALTLDGSNDDITFANITQLNSVSAFTVEVPYYSTGVNGTIWGKYYESTNCLVAYNYGTGTVRVFFGNTSIYAETPAQSLNTWHDLMIIYDGTKATNVGKLNVWIDGTHPILSFTGTIPATTPTNTSPFYIGTQTNASGWLTGFTSGYAKLYNRALSDSEAASNQAGNYTAAGLVSSWAIDEGTGTNIVDSQGLYAGTVEGAAAWTTGPLDLTIDTTRTRVAGAGVPSNSNGWVAAANGTMPYVEYYKHTVGTTLQQYVYWEYAATFTDHSAGGLHPATPTFRTTSSNAYVSAMLSSFAPVSQAQAPDFTLAAAATPVLTPAVIPEMYTELTVTLPGADLVNAILDAGTVPRSLFWFPVCMLQCVLAGLIAFALSRRLLVQIIAMGFMIALFAMAGVWGFMLVPLFAIPAFALLVAKNTYGF